MKRTLRYAILFAAALAILSGTAFGASNPPVEDMECHSERVTLCGGVTPPAATGVTATASCEGFDFTLLGLSDGSELIDRVRHYYGGSGDCPPDELLRSTNSELRASVSWTATAGASAFSGDGTKRGQTRMILGGIVCCYYYNVKIVAEIRDRFDFVSDRPGGRIKDRIYNGAAKIWSQIYNKWLGASSPDVELDINERFEKSGCY